MVKSSFLLSNIVIGISNALECSLLLISIIVVDISFLICNDVVADILFFISNIVEDNIYLI